MNFGFPIWITIAGKERYGHYAPMIGEGSLLELLQEAMGQDFLLRLYQAIEVKRARNAGETGNPGKSL